MKVSFGFYYKQFGFFVLIIFVVAIGYFFVNNQNFLEASSNQNNIYKSYQNNYDILVSIYANSKVKIGNNINNNFIKPQSDYDLFKYVAYSQEGITVDNLKVEIKLPKPINSLEEVNPRSYAVHGVGATNVTLLDPQTVLFEANDLFSNSTYSIELSFPKGYLNIPWEKNLLYTLSNYSLLTFMLISIIPLLLTFIVLFYIYAKISRNWQFTKDTRSISSPPSTLSPAEASVLINNKISSRSIASTFIDIAEKGYITIVDHGDYFTFNKNLTDLSKLKDYEQLLLDKIFTSNDKKSSLEDVELRISKHIFSRKIAYVYLNIYNSLFSKGYFMENPNYYQAHYKRFGYGMFFVGFFGFILSAIYTQFPYLLLIWFSIIVAASFIIKISPQIPFKTQTGRNETQKWQEFKNFLKLNKPFSYSFNSQKIYEKYLPYAIAFDCELEWTKRFVHQPFQSPKWLVSQNTTFLLEDILNEVVPFIKFISNKLTQIREPNS